LSYQAFSVVVKKNHIKHFVFWGGLPGNVREYLEVATGTGFIALKIALFVRHAEATDFPLVYLEAHKAE